MSNVDTAPPVTKPMARPLIEVSENVAAALAVVLGSLVALALCWGKVLDIWATGNFYDSDDAMRMVQVRDLLAGQGWYDMTAHKLDPPAGSFMHWSRLVDIPLAALMRVFNLFASADVAEKLTRIVFPLSLQVALLAAEAWVARLLLGGSGIAPTIALAVLSGFMFVQFTPGRVDHHAPQIVLLVLMLGGMIAAFDPARARFAALSALCVSLSLAISVENIPFILAVFATPPIAWIALGRAARPLLIWFAAGLAVATPVIFVAFNGPSRWSVPACDAFSWQYVVLAFGAAATSGACAIATRWDATALSRALVLLIAGVAAGAIAAPVTIGCLIDPFAGLDPLVREIWLDNVGEARPALRHFALYPHSAQTIVMPTLIGLIGLGVAVWRSGGLARARFALVLAFAVMGCAATFLMIRASSSLAPVVLLGCAFLATRLAEHFSARGAASTGALGMALVMTVPMSSIGWALAPSVAPARPTPADFPMSCLAASAFAPLARLPAGVALAPIEMGAFLLAHTPHSIVTASYHRANHGNRLAIDAFMARPETARDLVRASGARYVFTCGGMKELVNIAQRAPDGLAAALARGEAPAWLRPVELSETPVSAWVVE